MEQESTEQEIIAQEIVEQETSEQEQNITKLDYHGKEIILIATAHVSQDSVELVKEIIEQEKPDSVCIELDDGRFKNMQNPKAWEETDIVEVIKSKRVGFLLANLVLSSYQKKIAKNLDTQVGGEMIQGIKSAEEHGAQLVMADRSIQTTFLRIWRSMSLWEKGKLIVNLMFSFDDEDDEITEADLEEMLKQDVLESALSMVHGEFPKIGQILITERDQFLANKIKNAPGDKVVAVLGGAHVPGIKEEIYKDQDMEEISRVPEKGSGGKIAGLILPIAIVALVIYSFTVSVDTGIKGVSTWIMWNSGLAGLGAILALSHPLTVLVTILLAPFSAINPLVAVGWFSGLTEAYLRKPTVKDLQNVPDDIFSFKGFFKNRFLRILLVVILANVGGSIGNIVGGLGMFQNIL